MPKPTQRVKNVIAFIEKLIVPSGKGAGKTFKLRPFQKKFINDIYGPTKEGRRIVRRAILSVARKNGKSVEIACLALTHLVGPEAVRNGEIYSAANDREQASLIFKYAAQIVRSDPELESYIKIVDSTKTMVCFSNGSIYRAVSSEAGTKYGLNPTIAIYDELAQAKNRELYDALDTSMGARMGEGEEPLFIVISTQAKDPQHILSQLIDDGLRGNDPTTVCHLYEIPDKLDVFDPKNWKLANPALGDFRSRSEMATAAKRAQRMPTFEAAFRNLYCNQRVEAQSPLIPRAEWEGCVGDAMIEPGSDVYMGLDLSGKTDLTALVAVSAGEDDKVRPWFWKPKETLLEHERRDRVPYSVWEKQGVIETTPGRAIQYDWVAERIGKIAVEYNILGIAFDRWRIDDLLNAMSKIGLEAYVDGKDEARVGAIRMVPWGQGYASMTQAVEAMEVSILERKLIHDGNACMTWNISNAMALSDAAGNRKLDKSASRFRIDGAVALAMCLGLKSRDRMEQPEPSAFEGLTKEEILKSMAF
ncbi:MAG: terminase TerL endonuclease subunit [Dehalococcoidales bacterium]